MRDDTDPESARLPPPARQPAPALLSPAPGDAESGLFTPASRRKDLVAAYPELVGTCAELQFGDALTIGEWCSAPAWPLLRLARAARPPWPSAVSDLAGAGIPALIDDLQRCHHRPMSNELNRIDILVDEIALRHQTAELQPLAYAFARLKRRLLTHILYAKHLVFPRLRRLDEALRRQPHVPIAQPATGGWQMLTAQRAAHVAGLEVALRLTAEAACEVGDDDVAAIGAGLTALQVDLAIQAGKEDGRLIPVALAAEEEWRVRAHRRACLQGGVAAN